MNLCDNRKKRPSASNSAMAAPEALNVAALFLLDRSYSIEYVPASSEESLTVVYSSRLLVVSSGHKEGT
jgi:hypothetical protein